MVRKSASERPRPAVWLFSDGLGYIEMYIICFYIFFFILYRKEYQSRVSPARPGFFGAGVCVKGMA
jgi:hypothetical protein